MHCGLSPSPCVSLRLLAFFAANFGVRVQSSLSPGSFCQVHCQVHSCQRRSRSARYAARVVSSVVEHYLDTVGVAGSNPAPRTTFFTSSIDGGGEPRRTGGFHQCSSSVRGKLCVRCWGVSAVAPGSPELGRIRRLHPAGRRDRATAGGQAPQKPQSGLPQVSGISSREVRQWQGAKGA